MVDNPRLSRPGRPVLPFLLSPEHLRFALRDFTFSLCSAPQDNERIKLVNIIPSTVQYTKYIQVLAHTYQQKGYHSPQCWFRICRVPFSPLEEKLEIVQAAACKMHSHKTEHKGITQFAKPLQGRCKCPENQHFIFKHIYIIIQYYPPISF